MHKNIEALKKKISNPLKSIKKSDIYIKSTNIAEKALVVIDANIDSAGLLAKGIIPEATLLVIYGDNGIEQITKTLIKGGYTTLYLFCHGSPGRFFLGSNYLCLENIKEYSHSLQQWKIRELCIYSCRVGAKDIGQEFITQLHALTGANIAAATHPVGHGTLGGNWNLDCHLGKVNATLPIFPSNIAAYAAVLNTAPTFLGDGVLNLFLDETPNLSGASVSSIYSGQFQDIDVGSQLNGVAIVENNADSNTEGVYQYSTDGGITFFNIGVVDDANALILSASTLIRFIPTSNFTGSPQSLSVRAIDDTYTGNFSSGATRETINSSVNGGSSAISASTSNTIVSESGIAEDSYNISNGNSNSVTEQIAIELESSNNAPVLNFDGLDFEYRFTKILETGTATPSGVGSFSAFSNPSISGNNLAFRAEANGLFGIYAYLDGVLTTIADTTTAIPGGGTFSEFDRWPSISESNIAFRANNKTGIYRYIDGDLSVVANLGTTVPSGGSTFSGFASASPQIDGDEVAFFSFSPSESQGIYKTNNGTIETVAKIGTSVPGGGTFNNISGPAFDNGNITFFAGSTSGQSGAYAEIDGVLTKIADSNDTFPGYSGVVSGVGGSLIDDNDVTFTVVGPNGYVGRFVSINGIFSKVADFNTPIPGGTGTFNDFGGISIDNEIVVISGIGNSGQRGIYTTMGGDGLREVIDLNDELKGKSLTNLGIRAEAISGSSIAFNAEFTDGSEGIFIANPVLEFAATEDDAPFTIDLLTGASDPDANDVLNVANLTLIEGDNSGVTLNGNTLNINPDTYNSLAIGESERIEYSYDIIDGNGGSVTQYAAIEIEGVNDAPILISSINDQIITTNDDFDLNISNNFVDIDTNDSLAFSVEGLPSTDYQLDTTTGVFSGSGDFPGIFEVTVTATDSSDTFVEDTFSLIVANNTSGPGNDVIFIEETGDDFVNGGPGNDTVFGADANEVIVGAQGNDFLDGGLGSDKYIGGGGSDTYVIGVGDGLDTISGFQQGSDLIGLKGNLSFGSGGNVTFEFRQGATQIFFNTTEILAEINGRVDLTDSDFISV